MTVHIAEELPRQGSSEAIYASDGASWCIQGPRAEVRLSASQSSSFAFSRAGLALSPGVNSCPEEAEAARNANVHPLGFFAAEGARQLCQVEGEGPAAHDFCSQPHLPEAPSPALLILCAATAGKGPILQAVHRAASTTASAASHRSMVWHRVFLKVLQRLQVL